MKKSLKLIFCFLLFNHCVHAQQPKLMLPIGHTGPVYHAQFSPDQKKIITVSFDNTAKIWDVESGKLIADLKGHTKSLHYASFSLNGRKVVTASADNTAKIWDVASGSFILDLIGHTDEVISARFSVDGKKIVTSSYDHTAKVWDAVTGKIIADLKGHTSIVTDAQFSIDGKKIVTASFDNTAKIWDVASGQLIADLKGHKKYVGDAEFSSDGKKIVTASYDNTAKIWDVATGNLIADLKGHTNSVYSARFSADEKKIVTGSYDSTAKIWDAITGNLIADLKGHLNVVAHAEFSIDGKKIVTSSYDHTAKVWDAVTGKIIADLKGHISTVTDAQFSIDGKKIVTASMDGTAKVWDAFSGSLVTDLNGRTTFGYALQFSPDGKKIVTTSGNSAKIWDVSTWHLIRDLKGHKFLVLSAKFSPDGKKIVTASNDNTAKIWDIATGQLIADIQGHEGGVMSAEFSPDGKKIVTSSSGHVKISEADSGKLIVDLKGFTSYVWSAQFSSDGQKVVTVSDSSAKIWDAVTGNLLNDLTGHTASIRSARFSPDGKKIVTCSYDSTAKIWDSASGTLLFDLRGHKDCVNYAEFSPDGEKVVTASDDSTAKIWETAFGKVISDLRGHRHTVDFAKFSPDGKKIITESTDNTAKIWDASSGNLIGNLTGHMGEIHPAEFSSDGKKVATLSRDNTGKIWDVETGKTLYTFISVGDVDYLVIDSLNRYDGSGAARKLLYFTCRTEIIELDQVKDQLWVPNLAERINKGETINTKTLAELNICGLTPEVEVASTDDEYFFKIHPRRGGLGKAILFVNGIEAKRYEPRQLRKNGGDYELVIKKEKLKSFFVSGKENPVTLKAYTADNALSSRGVVINEDKTKEKPTSPNLFAVMVGVSDYKGDELDLKYAAKDATDISGAIANAAKKMLSTDDGKEHVFMYNLTTGADRYQLPEKNSIKKILEEIGKKATANDILLVFFAGHGVMSAPAGNDGEGGDKKQFYFLTADASKASSVSATADVGISTSELIEWMKPQNIRAQKRILIFDACNSGQAINDIAGKDLAVRNDDKAQQIKVIDKLNEKSGLFILSASASNQSAYEMGRYAQGLLTYSLLKAIKQQPDILEDGRYLDVSRWFNAAEKTVSDLSKETGARQEPQIVSNTNFNIGVVDEDVMAKIVLPDEKPLFAASLFYNSDEAADGDNLQLSKMINLQLNEFASRGSDSRIVYVVATNAPDAYSLSGRYDLKGEEVLVRISIKKNNETRYRFEEKGKKADLKELANAIVLKAAEWTAVNK